MSVFCMAEASTALHGDCSASFHEQTFLTATCS